MRVRCIDSIGINKYYDTITLPSENESVNYYFRPKAGVSINKLIIHGIHFVVDNPHIIIDKYSFSILLRELDQNNIICIKGYGLDDTGLIDIKIKMNECLENTVEIILNQYQYSN